MKKAIAVCAFIGCCLIGQGAARAAESYNIGHNSYTYLESPTSDADTVKSYLINNGDNTLTRVEYYDGELIAEDYDSEFNLLGSHELETELELFGGFYSGEEYNFFVFGQKNTEENDDTEVFRVVRYTKDWQRVDSAGLCGANTAEPFASGSLRMTECGDVLYIRTSRLLYTSNDGLRHQTNITLTVDIPEMEISYEWGENVNIQPGWWDVSHSFDQYIVSDGENIIAADLGDASPRAAALTIYPGSAGELFDSETYAWSEQISALPIRGEDGANSTGVSLGGLEVSESSYLIAGNTVAQDDTYDPASARNIFVTATDRDDFSERGTRTELITEHAAEDAAEVSAPQLVKLNDDSFLLLWTETGRLNYVFLNGEGEKVSEIYTSDGFLSDCKPVIFGGKAVWYVTANTEPIFFYIDLGAPGSVGRTEFEVSGECGADASWTLKNGTLTISGTGDFEGCEWSFDDSGIPQGTRWGRYAPLIEKAVIESGLTNIPENAFSRCKNMRYVSIPETVKTVGTYAFSDCDALEGIVFPNGVTKLGSFAFSGCDMLSAAEIPQTILSIGAYAFNDCVSLTELYYTGTENDWQTVDVSYGNETIENAALRFGGRLLPSAVSAELTETDGGCQFELRLENMFRSGKAAAVLYSGGRITGLTVADIAAGDETVFIDIAADTADSAAVFVWSGFSSMVPLCGPVRVTAGV